MPTKHIAILGAGNMGTALAVCATTHGPVVLWSIEPEVVKDINAKHRNTKYLPGKKLAMNITATGDLRAAVKNARLIVIAVPSHVVARVTGDMRPHLSRTTDILNVAKGVDPKTLRPIVRQIQALLPRHLRSRCATLSGPSIAGELAAGASTVVNIAADQLAVAKRMGRLLETPYFRLRATTDVEGTALGGTLKNIYALLLGMCDGSQCGDNSKAALLTLAVEEMNVLMRALGAKSTDAVHGFAGLGDLFVTGTSAHSRNRTFGHRVSQNPSHLRVLNDPSQTIEGVKAVEAIAPFARKKKLRAPLLSAVERVLFKKQPPTVAIRSLFTQIH